MKILLGSLLISGCLMILFISFVVFLEMGGITTEETTNKLGTPFRLPSYIYYDLLQLNSDDENSVEEIIWIFLAFLINMLIYAFPTYLLLLLVPRKMIINISEEPPSPPTFETEKENQN